MLNLFDSFILNKVTFMKKNNKSNILWLIISLLTLFYTWLGYEKFWLEKFNKYLLNVLDVPNNLLLKIIVLLLVLFSINTLLRCYKNKYLLSSKQFMYVDIIGYQLFVVNTVEKWMCFLLAYGRKPRFNVFNLILQEKCEFEVAK